MNTKNDDDTDFVLEKKLIKRSDGKLRENRYDKGKVVSKPKRRNRTYIRHGCVAMLFVALGIMIGVSASKFITEQQ